MRSQCNWVWTQTDLKWLWEQASSIFMRLDIPLTHLLQPTFKWNKTTTHVSNFGGSRAKEGLKENV